MACFRKLFDYRGSEPKTSLSGWPVIARHDKFVHEEAEKRSSRDELRIILNGSCNIV
jgi:hypothetical protein